MSLQSRFFKTSINDYFSWETYENLPKIIDLDVVSFSGLKNISRSYAAWHMNKISVFPHTKKYRLLRSILENDINEMQKVLNEDISIINENFDQKYGFSPITLAAHLDRYCLVQYLVLRGVDMDKLDDSGNTALMHAVKNWQFQSLKLLVSYGCDLQVKDQFGCTALDKAKQRNLHALIFYLNKHIGIQEQNQDCIRQELQKKYKIKNKNQNQEKLEYQDLVEFPNFDINFDFEKKFEDPLNPIIYNKKQYQKPYLYPFNDMNGIYNIKSLPYIRRNQEEKNQVLNEIE